MAVRLIVFVMVALSILQTLDAKTIAIAGDIGLGWRVPVPPGPIYTNWARLQPFHVGDVIVFDFKTGLEDVASVTKEAFLACNSTNYFWLETAGPASFTLERLGEYYFIGTMTEHCLLGLKMPINVTVDEFASSSAPRGPIEYIVGDTLGWLDKAINYRNWIFGKSFFVGDTLVFNFANGTNDVALVTKENFEKCNTNETISVESISPVKFLLNKTGSYYFTSTYEHRCDLGEKLAISVTYAPASSPSGSAEGPSSGGSSTAPAPRGPVTYAPPSSPSGSAEGPSSEGPSTIPDSNVTYAPANSPSGSAEGPSSGGSSTAPAPRGPVTYTPPSGPSGSAEGPSSDGPSTTPAAKSSAEPKISAAGFCVTLLVMALVLH